MPTIKGLVLMSRFEYLEKMKGSDALKEFLRKISTESENYVRQTINGASNYHESTLTRIDEILLVDYFGNEIDEFRKLGIWNAKNLMDRYFNLYMHEKQPIEFLKQYVRLRDSLIGSGEMNILEIKPNKLSIMVDYGQNIPRSVCLSEQGFVEKGMNLCGAKNIKINEETCAALSDNFICKYQISFK